MAKVKKIPTSFTKRQILLLCTAWKIVDVAGKAAGVGGTGEGGWRWYGCYYPVSAAAFRIPATVKYSLASAIFTVTFATGKTVKSWFDALSAPLVYYGQDYLSSFRFAIEVSLPELLGSAATAALVNADGVVKIFLQTKTITAKKAMFSGIGLPAPAVSAIVAGEPGLRAFPYPFPQNYYYFPAEFDYANLTGPGKRWGDM